VVFIAFDKYPTQMFSQLPADCGFTAAGDSHYDDRGKIFIQFNAIPLDFIMSIF
jgi:hypothetical protein